MEKNELVITVSPELNKLKKLLHGIGELSQFASDEKTAKLVQDNCEQALKNIENIIQLLNLNS